MALYAPDYYKDFHCIASACRHSCCVGWEIGIDEKTLYFYRAQSGAFGERLKASIRETDGCATFCLSEGKRCPFLNGKGLCDIILTLGEKHLTQICADHPRFRNFFSPRAERTEIGVGIACEAAARLILTKKEKTVLLPLSKEERKSRPNRFERYLLAERERLFLMAQNREKSLDGRIKDILLYVKASPLLMDNTRFFDVYSALERLDFAFDEHLSVWKKSPEAWEKTFDEAGEQLLTYFIYRHVSGAKSKKDLRTRAAFAALATRHVISLAAARGGTLNVLLDSSRIYSSEIEYCEENVAALLAFIKNAKKA